MSAAYEQNLRPIAVPASGDLSTKQFYVVDLDGSANIAVQTSVGGKAIGILQDKPSALGQPGEVAVSGMVSKAAAGAAYAAGAELMADGTGRLITAVGSAGNFVIARAMAAAGAAGVIQTVLLVGPYVKS